MVSYNYDLEYGHNNLSIQKKSLDKFKSFVIIDDLIATGGTVNCVYKILKSQNKEVTGLCVVAEIEKFDARSKLPFDISSQIKI